VYKIESFIFFEVAEHKRNSAGEWAIPAKHGKYLPYLDSPVTQKFSYTCGSQHSSPNNFE